MAVLEWDKTGERFYETGVSKTVLYPQDESGKYPKGVAWNGIVAINETPSGAEPTPIYADNIKYLNMLSVEEFGFGIEAYMYPDEFAECNGEAELQPGLRAGQQTRKAFGLSYQNIVGNDVSGDALGYKIHLIYGAMASPSEMSRNTVNDSPEAGTMSWECSTTPIAVKGFKPTSHLVIDSRSLNSTKLEELEKKLYGDSSSEATLPTPDEIIALVKGE